MADWSNSILTGFFTGVGVIVANWVGKKYIEPRLDQTHAKIHHKKGKNT